MLSETISFRDNSQNTVSIFRQEAGASKTVICLPAMGVRASYYESFARAMHDSGYHVLTVDWRGHGHSSLRASRAVDFGYEELVVDLHELIGYVEKWFPNTAVYVAGHSLGGQIGSLCAARYPGDIDGLILIASCMVYYKGWTGMRAYGIQLAGHLFHPLSRIVGYFPGNIIGFGGREARTLMHDWCYNGLYGNYRLANSKFDYEASLKRLKTPTLAISFEGDHFAPRQAVTNLYQKYHTESKVNHVHLDYQAEDQEAFDHFNWAKKPSKIVDEIGGWLKT